MNNMIISEIRKLGLGEVDLLALVTDTSYDVSFYANVDGKRIQSNTMVEEGLIDSVVLMAFYEKVATVIRMDEGFDPGALNVVKVNRNSEVSVSKMERNTRVYAIKKEWRNMAMNS